MQPPITHKHAYIRARAHPHTHTRARACPGISEPMQVAETFTMALDAAMLAELAERGLKLPTPPAAAKVERTTTPEGDVIEELSLSKFARLDTCATTDALASAACVLTSCLHTRPRLQRAPSTQTMPRARSCVTVVDAATFYDDLESIEELADR
jgi:hypothetical protein